MAISVRWRFQFKTDVFELQFKMRSWVDVSELLWL